MKYDTQLTTSGAYRHRNVDCIFGRGSDRYPNTHETLLCINLESLSKARNASSPPSFHQSVPKSRNVSVGVGQCYHCLCRTISQILSFCNVRRHVHSFKHSFCALFLTSVVNVFAAPAPLVVQPYQMCAAFDLLQTTLFAVRALACTGRHSRARGLLNISLCSCAKRRGRVAQDRLAKLQ